MMGQELFENISWQYKAYNVTPLKQLTRVVPTPDVLEAAEVTAEQIAAVEEALVEHPEEALTFDEIGGTWIVGTEADLEKMFTDREQFVDALDSGEDPGI